MDHNYMSKHFPIGPDMKDIHKLIELDISWEEIAIIGWEPSDCAAQKLTISMPDYSRKDQYHAAVDWINALPSLRRLTLRAGYDQKFEFGRDDSPLEYLDMSEGGKNHEIVSLNCPQLRRIRTSFNNGIFDAGMWVYDAQGNYYKFENGSFVHRVTNGHGPYTGEVLSKTVPGWSNQDGQICVPVNLPEGLLWGTQGEWVMGYFALGANTELHVHAGCLVELSEGKWPY